MLRLNELAYHLIVLFFDLYAYMRDAGKVRISNENKAE